MAADGNPFWNTVKAGRKSIMQKWFFVCSLEPEAIVMTIGTEAIVIEDEEINEAKDTWPQTNPVVTWSNLKLVFKS